MTENPMPETRKAGAHDWREPNLRFAWVYCGICGVVKRRDGQNKPCKGPTRLRSIEHPEGRTP